jgi:hypothetical protein
VSTRHEREHGGTPIGILRSAPSELCDEACPQPPPLGGAFRIHVGALLTLAGRGTDLRLRVWGGGTELGLLV